VGLILNKESSHLSMKNLVALINIYSYLTFSLANRIKHPEHLEGEINLLLKQAAALNLSLHIVMLDVMEGRVYNNDCPAMLAELEQVVKSFDIGYTFILDGENENISKVKGVSNIIYSDFMAFSSYINSIDSEDQECNEFWNNTKTKGLWTIGRPERPHRAILMSKLWENNLLDKIDWSFYTYPDNRGYIHTTLLSHYDDLTFEKFIKDCTRSLDFADNLDENFYCNGYPFDPNLYRNTSFSIVTESDFNISDYHQPEFTPKITEKTYRTIINRHPFISAWFPGIIKKLKSKGYRTFEEYTINPNYNEIRDLDTRLNAIVTNIDTFHERLTNPEVVEKVRADVEHNYQHYLKHVDIEIAKLQPIFDLAQVRSMRITPTRLAQFMFPPKPGLLGKN
jgi:hypothetical protein